MTSRKDLGDMVAEGFAKAQKTHSSFTNVSRQFTQLASDRKLGKSFLKHFISNTQLLLTEFKSPAVDRLVNFVSRFVAESPVQYKGVPFYVTLMQFLVHLSDVTEKAPRYRCTQLLAAILQALPDDVEIK